MEIKDTGDKNRLRFEKVSAITSATNIGCVKVDLIRTAKWLVEFEDVATGEIISYDVMGSHDGSTDGTTDAVNTDQSTAPQLRVNNVNFNRTVNVVLSGSGASQEMCVQVSTTRPSGVNVRVYQYAEVPLKW